MKAEWKIDGSLWTLNLSLHPEDKVFGQGQGTMTVGLLTNKLAIKLPREIRKPHPDLMAFAAFVIARPWIRNRFEMVGGAFSTQVAEEIHRSFNIDVAPVRTDLDPRTNGTRPILSFSGGADSVAAAELLPDETPHVHFRRVPHARIPNRATHVRTDAIENIVVEAGRRGRRIEIVRSDLEYICHPYPTLPHWFVIAVGCLLMADELDANALALGGTFETYFMDMGRKWTGQAGRGLDAIPALMGIPLLRPVAGATEIGTMNLTLQSNLSDIARSCVIGTLSSPCYECTKCVRKELTTAAIRGDRKIPATISGISPDAPGVKQMAGEAPYYMQAQLEYALSRLDVAGSPFEGLYARLGQPDAAGTTWMEHYYKPAAEVTLNDGTRRIALERLESKLGFMAEDHLDAVMSWSR